MATTNSLGGDWSVVGRRGYKFGPYSFTMANEDGSPVDLTGKTIGSSIKVSDGGADAPVTAWVITMSPEDAALGKFSAEISSASSALFPNGKTQSYKHTIYIAEGAEKIPLLTGTIEVRGS